MNKYDSPDDVQRRLHRSVVFFKNIPVMTYAHGMDVDLEYLSQPVEKDAIKSVSANDPNLDTSAPPIGYVNYQEPKGRHCVYWVGRAPIRQFLDGLHQSNTEVFDEWNNKSLPRGAKWPFSTRDLGYMLMNNYPTASDALVRLIKSEETFGVAFSRKLAFSRSVDAPDTIRLIYRTVPAGIVITQANPTNPSVTLLPAFQRYPSFPSILARHGVSIV